LKGLRVGRFEGWKVGGLEVENLEFGIWNLRLGI